MRSLDQNGDGNLELSEIPERMRGMFENRAKELGFDLARPIPIDRYLTERTGEGKHPTAFEEELQPSLAAGFDTPLSPEEEAMLRPERRREILLKNATPEVIGKGGSGAKKEGEKGQSKEDSQRDQQAAKAIIERYDSDKNGTIDGDEANSLPPFFRGYDANGDGKFTGEEFQTGLARMRSGGRGGGFGGGGFGGGGFGGRGGGGEDEQGEGDRRRGGRRGGFGGGGFGGPGGPGGPGGRGFDRGGDGERRPGRGGDESDEREGDQAEREGDEAESASRKSYRFTPAQERIPEGARSFILPKDKDGDGQVSMAEFATSWSDSKLQEFDSYDADGDGYITGAECLKKGAPSFRERRAARARGE